MDSHERMQVAGDERWPTFCALLRDDRVGQTERTPSEEKRTKPSRRRHCSCWTSGEKLNVFAFPIEHISRASGQSPSST